MSYIATVERDSLILQVLIGIVIAALVGTVTVVLVANHGRGGKLSATSGVTSPSIHQAPWKTHIFPAGAFGGVSKKDLKLVRSQAKPVTSVIERSLDALVLDPPSAKRVLRDTFTPPAAAGILGSHFGAPAGATGLRTTLRSAQVGIQTQGAQAAAAKVRIAFHATVKGHVARVSQAATLWLQRSHHAWHVVGFDVAQGPQVHHSHRGSKHGGAGGKGKHAHHGKHQ
ncbi:MAG: hypothetical protein QOC87_1963 [Actinomycetota bacterium]|jgi:hypothetical protein|nr:hypothetical protein [Actinomycetota bacterium]